MIETRRLEDGVAVAAQLLPGDMAAAAAAGFRAIVNNRPDGEQAGQPDSDAIEAAARAAGLDYRYLPMTPGELDPARVDGLSRALADLPGPVLAFCRSGTRSTMLWAAARAGALGPDAVVAAAADAGYDLAQMRPMFERLAR